MLHFRYIQSKDHLYCLSDTNRFYSPLVKSIAKKENISLEQLNLIKGTGYNGRVNKNDILNYIKSDKVDSIEEAIDLVENESSFLENKTEPMGHIRKMIAQHMIKSRDTSVHVYSSSEVDMTQIVNYRKEQTYKMVFLARKP